MINNETVKALRALKLSAMADELLSQLEEPQRYKDLSFEDRVALMVDAQNRKRRSNSINKRINEAKLNEKGACVENIEYHEDRHLDKGLITKLSTCAFINEHHHVVIKGAAGSGKSYIASALGNAACRKLYKVRYVYLSELLNEYAVAKALNEQNKVKTTYAKLDLLIIDEWLLRPLTEEQSYDLLEILDPCSKKGSIIFCTQYDTDDWYFRIDSERSEEDESAVTEAILDRIIHNKYVLDVKGRISMRKRHAFAEQEGSDSNG